MKHYIVVDAVKNCSVVAEGISEGLTSLGISEDAAREFLKTVRDEWSMHRCDRVAQDGFAVFRNGWLSRWRWLHCRPRGVCSPLLRRLLLARTLRPTPEQLLQVLLGVALLRRRDVLRTTRAHPRR